MKDRHTLEEIKLAKFTGQSGRETRGECHKGKLKCILGSKGEK